MLRFESEAEMHAQTQARREAFNSGSRGRIVTPEREVLAAVLELCKHHPSVAFAYRSNTRAGFLLNHDVYDRLVRAAHLKKDEARFIRFGVKGAHDVTGMLRGGRRLEIETKAEGRKLTDDQAAFAQGVNGGGGLAILAYSVDDVVKALEP
jgi:hypothetical protein